MAHDRLVDGVQHGACSLSQAAVHGAADGAGRRIYMFETQMADIRHLARVLCIERQIVLIKREALISANDAFDSGEEREPNDQKDHARRKSTDVGELLQQCLD
ncbi:hypothetical protein GCM10009563_31710 [Subtercola frigoramans]